MAKVKTGDTRKVSLGKRKEGKAKKSFNKHEGKPKKYRGQGK